MRRLLLLPALALIAAQPAPPAKPKTPTDVIAAAKPAEWAEIPADELMVIDLASGKRVVVQRPADHHEDRAQREAASRRRRGDTAAGISSGIEGAQGRTLGVAGSLCACRGLQRRLARRL